MTTKLQLRRGTTSEHSTFTGGSGEVTVDTTKKTAVVHDNATVGGFALLREDLDNLANGTVGVEKLDTTGTPGTNSFLRGDGSWATPEVVVSAFPSGTRMLFQQTSAPTGWTKITTYNDRALRVVSGTAGTGGTTTFTSVFQNQTPTITVSGISIGATTLSTAQMPSHGHSYTTSPYRDLTVDAGGSYGGVWREGTFSATTGAQGGGGSHSHSVSGGIGSSSTITLDVQYVDVIIARKD